MKVQVLMSTYNGEKYIEEQIQSLINNQKDDIQLNLMIRDDGSSDNTIPIIKNIQKKNQMLIELIEDINVGVTKSFLKLIEMAPEADLYFFCDQDDVWSSDKISIIETFVKKNEQPTAYVSGYYLTDAELNVQSEWIPSKNTENSLLQILFANMVPGCVMGFNRSFVGGNEEEYARGCSDCMRYMRWQQHIAVANSIYEKPLVYYRQHGNNVEGVHSKKINLKRIWKKQKKIWTQGTQHTSELAVLLLKKYEKILSTKKKDDLQLTGLYRNALLSKCRLLLKEEIYYSGIRAKVQTLEKILLGKF